MMPEINLDDLQVSPAAPLIPHSREAEEAVIGSAFLDPSCYFEVSRLISAEDFFIHRLRWIWEAIDSLTKAKTSIDLLTVADYLEHKGILADAGGPSFLTSLIAACPTSLNAFHYAEIIKEYAERRKGITIANEIAQGAYNLNNEFHLGEYAQSVATAARGKAQRVSTKEAASRMIDLVSNPRAFTTGIIDIDQKAGGLFPEELSVLAGYQGTGKSAEKLQGARRNAEAGRRVMLCDLEMTAAQTWFRMACGDIGVDMNQVRSGKVSDEKQKQVINYAAELGDYYEDKIIIYQAPMTPADIMSAAMMERPDLIYVDTLKNLSGKQSRQNMVEWYDFCLNFLRINVAQRTGAHVQVLHHINRSTFKENRKPSMHDLMFAGESDADAIFILYRKQEDYAVINDGAIKTIVPITWITDKSRFGWTGEEEINFHLINQKFFGMTRESAARR